MKQLLFMSVVVLTAVACNNAQTETHEEKQRDSMADIQKSADQRYVDSIMAADDSIKRTAEPQHPDSDSHEGHDHSGHDHSGHSHEGHSH